MQSSRLRRLATVATGASLALMLLGPGAASASVAPFEFINYSALPDTVTPGADAGYQFTIHNKSLTTNISQLFLSAPAAGVVSFIATTRDATVTCQKSPSLYCAFGALNANATINVVVAYSTVGATSPFSVTFKIDSGGVAGGDPHKSHGDSVSLVASTTLSSDKDFTGAFELTSATLSTDQTTLGKRNNQASSVTPPSGPAFGDYQPVTIQEGVTPPADDPCATATCLGSWSFVRVGNGTVGPVELQILLYGPSVPGSATLANIFLYHTGDTQSPISLRCAPVTDPDSTQVKYGGTQECINVTMQGHNFLIDAWLNNNGGYRGGYG